MKISKIICAGLNCLDLQLIGCTQSGQEEAIEHYDNAVYCAGGSSLQTAIALSMINPVVGGRKHIQVLTKLGNDRNGEILLDFMTKAGVDTQLTLVDPTVATAMAILPIFQNGKRGCFFNLASNNSFTKEEILNQLELVKRQQDGVEEETLVDAFLFGYPHLMPKLQGDNLKRLLESTQKLFGKNTLIGVDLNGVSSENHNENILGPALKHIDILHLNEEEAEILLLLGQQQQKNSNTSGSSDDNNSNSLVHEVTNHLHQSGCAVVLLSLGSKGSFISITSDENRLAQIIAKNNYWKAGSNIHIPAFAIPEGRKINTNGAGDALFAGFCWAASSIEKLTLEQAGNFASLVARQRCDSTTRDITTPSSRDDANTLLDMVLSGKLPPIVK
mmetsp:Transcript_37742/g.43106  ORF Transcript_37742/g.43106 Transcript_37742/m.43106 type:complete len:388 (-) Transcript_37742:30-1193(-)